MAMDADTTVSLILLLTVARLFSLRPYSTNRLANDFVRPATGYCAVSGDRRFGDVTTLSLSCRAA